MSVDEQARIATVSLRQRIDLEVDPNRMLTSVRRTRARRRAAVALPAAVAVAAVAVALQGVQFDRHPAPSHSIRPAPSFVPQRQGNGELVGFGNAALTGPHVPPIAATSSPTWSPDGNQLAVLDGGILITHVRSDNQRRVPCRGCQEIAWSPDGSRFAAVDRDRTDIAMVDADTGAVLPLGLPGLAGIHSVTWSPTAERLAFVAASSRTKSGVFVVGANGLGLSAVVSGPLSTALSTRVPARMAAVSWSFDDRLAVLALTAAPGQPGRFALGVMSMTPNGGRTAVLGSAGTCGCVGWTPNLVWSPDATTLAVYTPGHPRTVSSLDGDGRTVTLRYVHGNGPLAWQPR